MLFNVEFKIGDKTITREAYILDSFDEVAVKAKNQSPMNLFDSITVSCKDNGSKRSYDFNSLKVKERYDV